MSFRATARSISICAVLLIVAACSVRSISDSGYHGGRSDNRLYRGELSEFDVLGIDRNQQIAEADIQHAIASRQPISLKKGSSLMLIQSGAMFPDDPMAEALENHFMLGLFSGMPDQDYRKDANAAPSAPYLASLRIAAARGGYQTIVAYWGVLETSQDGLGTKAVSWVPFVGTVIPDETQNMRIRLKMAIIDVATGQWEMFMPEPQDDETFSARINRESSDQAQVESLKATAYQAAVAELLKRYDS